MERRTGRGRNSPFVLLRVTCRAYPYACQWWFAPDISRKYEGPRIGGWLTLDSDADKARSGGEC